MPGGSGGGCEPHERVGVTWVFLLGIACCAVGKSCSQADITADGNCGFTIKAKLLKSCVAQGGVGHFGYIKWHILGCNPYRAGSVGCPTVRIAHAAAQHHAVADAAYRPCIGTGLPLVGCSAVWGEVAVLCDPADRGIGQQALCAVGRLIGGQYGSIGLCAAIVKRSQYLVVVEPCLTSCGSRCCLSK